MPEQGAWLGVTLSDVTPEKARNLKLAGEYGAVVEEVEENSPAARAGIEKGDVILAFAGEKVWSVAQFRRRIGETPPGRDVALLLSRDGKTRSVTVKLEARSESFMMPQMPSIQIPSFRMPEIHIPRGNFEFDLPSPTRLGVSGVDLTPQLAAYFGVSQGKGVLVSEVFGGTPAEKAGLKSGDCIVRFAGADIGTLSELREALARTDESSSRNFSLTIVRDRREQTLTVGLERPSDLNSPSVALSHRVSYLPGKD